ncbi:MAG: ABC transporter substrate-binding protein [Candidatus Aenigmarchaeota archaeon]|nr:ABC transporter substrate-binding protein [Candidatus Aenigmarchaeota archaeon]
MVRDKRMGFGLQAVLASLLVAVIFLGGCTTTQNEKVYHVGVLSGLSFVADITDGLKAKMTELGYTEGKNIVYDVQETNVDPAAYRQVLNKFVANKVDLILAFPTEVALEAKAATQGIGIPVVFANAVIENTGLVNSVREPGGNITGVRFSTSDLALRRFEILHELAPHAKQMWIPYQRGYPIVASQLGALQPVAASAGVTMIEVPADNATELETNLQTRVKSSDISSDAILCIVEPLMTMPDTLAVLGKFAAEHKLPIGGCPISNNSSGSIFMTAPDNVDVGKLAASIADKILKGTPAGTIPVVTPESRLRINYKVIQELGLNVSEGLLNRADEIIR